MHLTAAGNPEPVILCLDWLVARPTRLAVLDTAFVLRVARWPQITAGLCGRIAQRARNLALAQAVTHLPRTHPRLPMSFWITTGRSNCWPTPSGWA